MTKFPTAKRQGDPKKARHGQVGWYVSSSYLHNSLSSFFVRDHVGRKWPGKKRGGNEVVYASRNKLVTTLIQRQQPLVQLGGAVVNLVAGEKPVDVYFGIAVRLDHTHTLEFEALVTSRISGSLYIVRIIHLHRPGTVFTAEQRWATLSFSFFCVDSSIIPSCSQIKLLMESIIIPSFSSIHVDKSIDFSYEELFESTNDFNIRIRLDEVALQPSTMLS
ncbi:hypothetical protein RND71_003299 [Anisodus tanguticus]|uniref:Uncharacterized protein n=1 Tax=Anisodus tanguticus TaxID=243964 RepID=A0AAE1VNK7_9SOLA|nr:hypothetical protein RND71_003299 [Anisodus tanguticus]